LAQKPKVLAITKMDLLDAELQSEIQNQLPEGLPSIFISSVMQKGMQELKDLLWKEIV